ncbi:hypothetical protein [Streptomyces sp. NPDC007905]|uniref:hypothetical protein n=1 Tax=Streptomyces sp. NPDC007905 TaxID=3364788 RepID=UPI0036E328C0
MSSILKRAAGPAVVAGLLVTSFATPAAAQTPGSVALRHGGSVVLSAGIGVQNHVTASVSGGRLILTDLAGIAAGPGCSQVSTTSADCGNADTVSRLTVSLGDQNDSAQINAAVNTSVYAGSGADTVATGGGSDTVFVSDGVSGNDTVTCGDGSDTVFGDPGDHIATNCEVRFPF